jgi:GrpB-like predicted nucleotidyltransferase (UPF0157 family)
VNPCAVAERGPFVTFSVRTEYVIAPGTARPAPASSLVDGMADHTVVVVDYDEEWPRRFEDLRARLWPVVADVAVRIEHVGSTAVPGLAAKPIVDLTIVVTGRGDVPLTIERLANLGYRHLGDLGIDDREAFDHRADLPRHNLYVCPEGTIGIVNQLAVRDYLRAHPDTARRYGELKKRLAARFPDDIDSYIFGKTDLILDVLRRAGLIDEQLAAIERVNRRS